MDRWVFSFITGAFLSLFWHTLPPAVFLPIICVLAVFFLRFSHTRPISGFLFGSLWMASVGHWTLNWQLPSSQIAEIQQITGVISNLTSGHNAQGLTLKVKSIYVGGKEISLRTRWNVKLNWRTPSWQLKQGQIVHFPVRLKPAYGLSNQGRFYYQQWLFSQNIVATGYVKSKGAVLLDPDIGFRQTLYDQLNQLELQHGEWIAALTLGERRGLSQEQWRIVQSTGIAHLIAISGLHLTAVATVTILSLTWLLKVTARIFTLRQNLNLQKLTWLSCIAICLFYAWIAGFGVPVLRAFITLLMVALLMLNRRYWRVSSLILWCVFLFILLFPRSLFTSSFWLSYGAVLCLGFILWRWPHNKNEYSGSSRAWQVLRLQWLLCVLMLPILGWQFSYTSVISPLVNLLAVPLVTLVIVPLCLLGMLCLILQLEMLRDWIFHSVDFVLDKALSLLFLLDNIPYGMFHFSHTPALVWGVLLSALIGLCLPISRRLRLLSVILTLPFLSYQIRTEQPGWELDVLDVGQGTAVLISKNNRAILYDTGAAFPSGYNMAEAVILPVLAAKGIKKLDLIIISHFDNDHAGSLGVLTDRLVVDSVISNIHGCHGGLNVTWQALKLTSLWPVERATASRNHNSCVVQIDDGTHRVLLTGDIDKYAEQTLVANKHISLASDVLIAPHHGSKTSSSEAFIQAVRPKHVVFTVGYMNQWDFPRQSVVNRYYLAGSQMYSTAELGQINFSFLSSAERNLIVSSSREHMYHYWYANY